MLVWGFGLRRTGMSTRRPGWRSNRFRWASVSTATIPSSSSHEDKDNDTVRKPPQSVAVVGGGLAGLAVVYHLLLMEQQQQKGPATTTSLQRITVYDTAPGPGLGGASAVAGGLVHPLSPRGKLVHWGLQGLEATNELIDAAVRHSHGNKIVVLQDCIWRVASTPTQVQQLQQTARDLVPQLPATMWRDVSTDLLEELGVTISQHIDEEEKGDSAKNDKDSQQQQPQEQQILGALRLSNGCRVVHVPSYLQGLWKACQEMASSLNVPLEWRHLEEETTTSPVDMFNITAAATHEHEHDTVVLAAGASLFSNYLKDDDNDNVAFPIQLVRGQSLEFVETGGAPANDDDDDMDASQPQQQQPSLLCGKYISPLPPPLSKDHGNSNKRVLVGATHEFSHVPASHHQVQQELRSKTEFLAPHLWSGSNYKLDRVTSGIRVQSRRGKYGRLPLVGRLAASASPSNTVGLGNTTTTRVQQHDNVWILTGLSSRGLLYHALCAKALVQAIWAQDETVIWEQYPELNWWKTAMMSKKNPKKTLERQQQRVPPKT